MIKQHNIKISGSKDKPILLDAYYINNENPKPIVIMVHGFKGFKDWGHFNVIAHKLAEAEFVVVKFNFSHNGTTDYAPNEFADLEAFGQNNFSIELNDLGNVVDIVLSGDVISLKEISKKSVSLIGHSRGGGISILRAAQDNRISKLITWASVAEFGRYWNNEVMEKWKKEGVMIVKNARTNQDMPLYYQLYDNYFENYDRLHIPTQAKNVAIPWLIVHGTNDEAVPAEAANELHSLNDNSELILVDDGNHTFGGRHPWKYQNLAKDMQKVADQTIRFLKA